MVGKRQVSADCQSPPSGAQFAELVPPLAPLLFRVAAALIGPADAEDAAQEAILQAWKQWSKLRDITAVRPWLLQITVNVCRQWHRGHFGTRRRHTVPLSEADLLEDSLLAGNLNTTEVAAALDLRQALDSLPQHLRLIVALRYFGDMDATEIGLFVQVAPVTVRARLRRALVLLRTALRVGEDLPLMSTPGGES